MIWKISGTEALSGEMVAPPDKSITHRALMLAGAATTESRIMNPLRAEDCQATLHCLEQLGVQIEEQGNTTVVYPPQEWRTPSSPLNCGNSGTTMRLLAGMIASRPVEAILIGDESLSKRPMQRIANPLRQMGATIAGDSAPLHIRGGELHAIDYVSAVASAQIKSAVLLAATRATGTTTFREPSLSRDHTERMLKSLGVHISTNSNLVAIGGGATWKGFACTVPGDISSAAFFLVAGTLLKGPVTILNCGVNPTRTGILDILNLSGARPELSNPSMTMGEPMASVTTTSAAELTPFSIQADMVPRLIDEIPVLAVLATQCQGKSTVRGAKELRVKESDRIEAVVKALQSMGANICSFEDGFDIIGPTKLHGANINATGDHRIAMAFAVAALIAEGETTIYGAESVQTSYPSFESELKRLCNR